SGTFSHSQQSQVRHLSKCSVSTYSSLSSTFNNSSSLFFFNATATTEIYTLSLHDALPISSRVFFRKPMQSRTTSPARAARSASRSEEHTSELQSPCNLVCRLLLEKKKKWRQPLKLLMLRDPSAPVLARHAPSALPLANPLS